MMMMMITTKSVVVLISGVFAVDLRHLEALYLDDNEDFHCLSFEINSRILENDLGC